MSLYNMLFGVNPASGILMAAVGVGGDDYPIPRFRDCYLQPEGDGWLVVVHTRTGGGNRDCYCGDPQSWAEKEADRAPMPDGQHREDCYPFMNDRLTAHPLYVRDWDDDFDCTYANFAFRLPTELHPIAGALAGQQGEDPTARWQALFKALDAGDEKNPDYARAMEAGRQLLPKINEALEKGGYAVVEV